MTLHFDTLGGVLCGCLITTGCSLQRQENSKRGCVEVGTLHSTGDPDFLAEQA